VPDAIDEGKEPFIKPFMTRLADDHYALDVRRARKLLGWEPRHRLQDDLPAMVRAVKDDPAAWYERNGIDPPDWMATAAALKPYMCYPYLIGSGYLCLHIFRAREKALNNSNQSISELDAIHYTSRNNRTLSQIR
jgi:hypothetical protein